jgi:hypothetical protein
LIADVVDESNQMLALVLAAVIDSLASNRVNNDALG